MEYEAILKIVEAHVGSKNDHHIAADIYRAIHKPTEQKPSLKTRKKRGPNKAKQALNNYNTSVSHLSEAAE